MAVLEAGIRWLECPAEASNEEYDRRQDAFLHACARMFLAKGWRPPEPAGMEQPGEREALAG